MPLFFDTETTGFPKDKLPSDDPEQPHIVQLAAILDDENGNIKASMNIIINADCGPVPEKAYNVHKISEAIYKEFGISYLVALAPFNSLVQCTDVIVAHNTDFDLKILKIAYARLGKLEQFTSKIQSKPQFCTMLATTDIVKIPNPRGRGGYKWPKLDEAYRVLVNPSGFAGAHDAFEDVKACREVFYSLEENS